MMEQMLLLKFDLRSLPLPEPGEKFRARWLMMIEKRLIVILKKRLLQTQQQLLDFILRGLQRVVETAIGEEPERRDLLDLNNVEEDVKTDRKWFTGTESKTFKAPLKTKLKKCTLPPSVGRPFLWRFQHCLSAQDAESYSSSVNQSELDDSELTADANFSIPIPFLAHSPQCMRWTISGSAWQESAERQLATRFLARGFGKKVLELGGGSGSVSVTVQAAMEFWNRKVALMDKLLETAIALLESLQTDSNRGLKQKLGSENHHEITLEDVWEQMCESEQKSEVDNDRCELKISNPKVLAPFLKILDSEVS